MATLTKMFGKKGSSNSMYKLGNGSSLTVNASSSTETIPGTNHRSRSKSPSPAKQSPEAPPHVELALSLAQIVLKEMGDVEKIAPKRHYFQQNDRPPVPLEQQPLPARWIKSGEIQFYKPDVEYWCHPDGSVRKYPPPWEPPKKAPSLPPVDKASIYKQLNKSSSRLDAIAEQDWDEEDQPVSTTSGGRQGANETSASGLRRKSSTPAMRHIAPPVPAPGHPMCTKQSQVRSRQRDLPLAQLAMSNALASYGKVKAPAPAPTPTTTPLNVPVESLMFAPNEESDGMVLRGLEESGEPRKLSVNHVYRYRKQYGVNVEGWFFYDYRILEPLLGQRVRTELQFVELYEAKDVRSALEEHYSDWMCEADFVWLRDHGFNTIRVGIPYWALIGINETIVPHQNRNSFLEVYGRAWKFLLDKIEMARRFGFGVLAVLQEAAGGHNKSQSLSVLPLAMFKAENSHATIDALVALVNLLHAHPNVVGVELLAAPDFDQQFKLQRWYERAVEAIRSSLPQSVSEDFPIYVPDAWDPERFANWVGTRQDFVILDHHVSRVFRTFNHRFKPYWYPMEHEDIIDGTFAEKLKELQAMTKGKAIVGEWYSAQSATGEVTEKEITVTVGSQLAMFRKHCPGNFFSQYKAGVLGHTSTALALYEMDLFPAWVGGRNPNQPVNDLPWHLFGRYKEKAIAAYKRKMNDAPELNYRNIYLMFADGFAVGWDDAITFATAIGVCELGFRPRWIENRTREYREMQAGPLAVDPLPEFGEGFEVGFDIATELLVGP